jgi:hypothetical protein
MARASATAENNALAGLTLVGGGTFSGAGAAALGINTADPGTTGANEVTGGAYARQGVSWGSPSSGSVANITSPINVSIPSSTTVSYFSTWNQTTVAGSVYQIGGALSSTINFITAGTLTIAIGGLTITAS